MDVRFRERLHRRGQPLGRPLLQLRRLLTGSSATARTGRLRFGTWGSARPGRDRQAAAAPACHPHAAGCGGLPARCATRGEPVAPQRQFPVPVTQAYDVTAWVAANGPAHHWDGSRLAVGGHSAGATLTVAVCRTARDRGTFAPRLQIIWSSPRRTTACGDEGDAYAKALEAAGVPVTHRVFEGVDHYFTHTGPVAAGKQAIDLMAGTLRAALGT
ncbi:hypothetical protein SY2F82_38200 [Streptomyces sp. Y2F8-2]|uniref:alpha/beta hydrolase n=1 Tax=Streptomyces sp. Y2F8-2 TaxID=2759675 RepID=UPI001A52AB8D|nr:hypothetical protein SY2F82_38200 [Streptomyces sp. Y2F8-2]